jgi:hypothetical protein
MPKYVLLLVLVLTVATNVTVYGQTYPNCDALWDIGYVYNQLCVWGIEHDYLCTNALCYLNGYFHSAFIDSCSVPPDTDDIQDGTLGSFINTVSTQMDSAADCLDSLVNNPLNCASAVNDFVTYTARVIWCASNPSRCPIADLRSYIDDLKTAMESILEDCP